MHPDQISNDCFLCILTVPLIVILNTLNRFSENSLYALEYASFIAKTKGVKLVVLHITKNEDRVKDRLENIRALPCFKGVNVEVVTRPGKSISKTINKVGIEFNVTLFKTVLKN